MTAFQELSRRVNELHEEIKANGKDLYLTTMKEFMAQHPEVLVFSFYQYTPAFNDGDPCYNRVAGPYLLLKDDPNVNIDNVTTHLDEDTCSSLDEDGREALAQGLDDSGLTNRFILEQCFGTNTAFLAKRGEDGTVEFEEGYYDCGY